MVSKESMKLRIMYTTTNAVSDGMCSFALVDVRSQVQSSERQRRKSEHRVHGDPTAPNSLEEFSLDHFDHRRFTSRCRRFQRPLREEIRNVRLPKAVAPQRTRVSKPPPWMEYVRGSSYRPRKIIDGRVRASMHHADPCRSSTVTTHAPMSLAKSCMYAP